jgi:LysR family transcriptional regulator, transcriptional activator of nhaA
MQWVNYHHLLYFWVVAREGSIAKACDVLHLAQPTISTQLHKLERMLGGKLFERSGRHLHLTDLGRLVYRYCDDIFALGQEMLDAVRGRPVGQPLQLAVGIADVLAKLVVYRLLSPALKMAEPVQLVCREGHFEELLSELVTFNLDIVLSDAPVGPGTRVKAYNHLLGECGISIFGVHKLSRKYERDFPRSLSGAPMLLPGAHTSLRRSLDQWFDEHDCRPANAGEFQDSALMKVFGQEGLGLFPAPTVIEREVCEQYNVHCVGHIAEVRERFYAISVERRLKHPAVLEISKAAKVELFGQKAS